MQSFFSLDELLRQRLAADKRYLEFLRVPALSCGLYVLAAGAADPQKPHREDEVYYVIRGAARMIVDGEDRAVTPGDVIFVSAQQDHRFHSITEELVVLVMFAPAES